MAAASYWSGEFDEDYLESQALSIDNEILMLQARIRGLLYRLHAGLVRQLPIVSFEGRFQVVKTRNHNCVVQADCAKPDLTPSIDREDDEKKVDSDSEYVKTILDDPDFAEKKINDMPNGWVAACTPDGDPFFVETETSNSTWTHPRQGDSSLLFGADFSLFWAWKQYLVHSEPGPFPLGLGTPTIGELAVYHRAIEGRIDSSRTSRWWQKNDPSCPSQPLCEVCRHINFDSLLHTTDAWGDTNAIPLGSLRGIANKIHCAFCRLVAKFASIKPNDVLQTLYKIGMIIRCNLSKSQDWVRSSTTIRILYLDVEFLEQGTLHRSFRLGGIHQILQDKERPAEQRHNDSRLVKDLIDVGLIKSWLQICERQHQSVQCTSSLLYPSFAPPETTDIHAHSVMIKQPCQPLPLSENSLRLTLIDVQMSCLIDADPDVRYIALSYVWGGPQPFQNTKFRGNELRTPGAISAEDPGIPQTIRDAIKIVGLLGERYLWVDSLCIAQDNTHEKKEQISNMGNIYSRAFLTLVAAHGSSCHAGLPGVRPDSRKTAQHVEQVGGMLLSNELDYLHDIVRDSVWNTRGWTYQERELSKRCLFFTQTCVYFSCNQMVCKEDSGLRDVSLGGEKSKRVRAERHPVWNNYRRAVQKFTKRTFTYHEDVINAFEGIVSLLQPAFKCDFLYGLPETELDVALLWQPKSAIRRRIDEMTGEPMFPSWSWAGWIGKIDYVWTKHLLDDLSRVQWQVQSTDTKVYITSDQLRAPRSGQHGSWEYVEVKGEVPYYYQPEHPDIWCLHPTAPKEARLYHSLLLPDIHVLKFKAMTAMLRIVVKPHVEEAFNYDQLSCCTSSRHIRCPVEIISPDGFIAGTVYVPAHLMGKLRSEPREFVCLSRRRGHEADTLGTQVYEKYQGYETYPKPMDDFEKVPKHPTLYPGQLCIKKARDKYDHARYNEYKPWPLYNVMLVERKDDLVFRVAIGIVHVTAFLQAAPTEKLINLA